MEDKLELKSFAVEEELPVYCIKKVGSKIVFLQQCKKEYMLNILNQKAEKIEFSEDWDSGSQSLFRPFVSRGSILIYFAQGAIIFYDVEINKEVRRIPTSTIDRVVDLYVV